MFRFVAVPLVLVVAIAAVVLVDRLPPEESPFAPLDLERPIGWTTRMKLAALRHSPEACREAIARSDLDATPVPDRDDGGFCVLRNVVAIHASPISWSPPIRVSCPVAAAIYVWEREVVEPAAARHLHATVRRIEHFGTYACRRVRRSDGGPPSQHATANAIDIAGFRLANGRRITVARDWNGEPAERAFLREVRDGACRVFRAVLGPDYNAAHADHFHLDMGPWGACR